MGYKVENVCGGDGKMKMVMQSLLQDWRDR
jgi:hypothetical protein